MFTRKQRLAGQCTHREFWGQLVTPGLASYVVARIGGDRLTASGDEYFNDISIREWDAMQIAVRNLIDKPMAEIGITWISLSDCVSAAKESARQWLEQHRIPKKAMP